MTEQKAYVLQAILAASLFGAGAPVLKLLLDTVEPLAMASLLYLGSGLGLFLFSLLKRLISGENHAEAGLARRDILWLLGATLSGGVVAPILLTFSLKQTPAATASLLLNVESAATAVIAGLVFREAIGGRVWAGIVCITVAGVLLSLDTRGRYGFSPGAIGILSACALWGLDNNLTRHISSKDPVAIAVVKGVTAGAFVLMMNLFLGAALPGLPTMFLSFAVGLFCYGLSIVFFIQAMRGLGAARTGAYFALAPFIGAALSFVIFRGMPDAFVVGSLPLLVVGVILLFKERHTHMHTHVEMEHDHSHTHDDIHHRHPHYGDEENEVSARSHGEREGKSPSRSGGIEGGDPALCEGQAQAPTIVHSHVHRHEPMVHAHSHMPDIHHRHSHQHKEITEAGDR